MFARAPVPGAVKTRLIPRLGPDGAAALHARLVKRTLETVRGASLRHVELYCDPGPEDPFFGFCAGRYGVTLKAQAGGDLGMRMLEAFEASLRGHSRVLLVGTDCPALAPRHLRDAERALREGDEAVLVPCEDGGYALMGLTRVAPGLFEGIDWGSPRVLAATRARLSGLGWKWRELETLWDVDRPEDYQRLVASGLLDERPAAGPGSLTGP